VVRLLLTAAFVVGAACSSEGDQAAPAPWLQLERYAGPDYQLVIGVDLDSSYMGHRNTSAVSGSLVQADLASLQRLFSDALVTVYAEDALPTTNSAGLHGTPGMPVYRIVVRRQSERITAGHEKMIGYFSPETGKQETRAMLAEVSRILDSVESK
jgi:hypothetical protein